jgi:hypothetical protein
MNESGFCSDPFIPIMTVSSTVPFLSIHYKTTSELFEFSHHLWLFVYLLLLLLNKGKEIHQRIQRFNAIGSERFWKDGQNIQRIG